LDRFVTTHEKYQLNRVTERVHDLPTLPTIVYELSRVINNPMSSTKEVEGLMEQDQVLTTKVLKLVNSAYYAIPGGVSSLERAIAFLGFDTVNQLVLSTSVIGTLKVESGTFPVPDFWAHSLGVGIASETIAKMIHHPAQADAFTAGLVHDLGKIILLTLEPDLFMETVNLAKDKKMTFLEAETQLGIANHVATGTALAERWNLPLYLQQSIKYHHTAEISKRVAVSPDRNSLIDMVCLGNLLIHALKFGNGGHDKVLNAPKELFQRLSMDPSTDLKRMLVEIKASLEKASDFLRMMMGPV